MLLPGAPIALRVWVACEDHEARVACAVPSKYRGFGNAVDTSSQGFDQLWTATLEASGGVCRALVAACLAVVGDALAR